MPSRSKSASASGDVELKRRRPPVQEYLDADLLFDGADADESAMPLEGEEIWSIILECKKEGRPDRFIQAKIPRPDLSYLTLMSLKEQSGYGTRDFLYYKKRTGNAEANLQVINYRSDADDMVKCSESERRIRILMTSQEENEDIPVTITPLKRSRERGSDSQSPGEESDDDEGFPEDYESLNAYKDWLKDKGSATDLRDEYRHDTIETYTEWLRDQGFLRDILSFANSHEDARRDDESNGSCVTPPEQWPAHARKEKQKTKGGKNVGRGSLKGLAAMAKRAKARTQKLKINFSSSMGGPYGENRRTFVDEVVMYTRLKTPLIGVRHWKDVSVDVKIAIAEDVMEKWDMDIPVDEAREKVWKVAQERYKGWRSTFSATYRAYNHYDQRMKHKPEDLDIVEWHYLILYFGTKKFKEVSSQNSSSRLEIKSMHSMGSKPFSQCSWEQRDVETGAEPGPLELFKTTRSKRGKWSSEMSETIYTNASRKLSMNESNEEGIEESRHDTAKEDLVLQETYKETTRAKSNKTRGHGYMSNPNRNHLQKERFLEQEREIVRLREHLAQQEAQKEAEKEQLVASIRASVMQEIKAMMAQNLNQGILSQTAAPGSNNTIENEDALAPPDTNHTTENEHTPAPETNHTIELQQTTPETNHTPADGAMSNEELHTTPVKKSVETPNREPDETEPRSILTTQKANIPPSDKTKSLKLSKNLFNTQTNGKATGAKYISRKEVQLLADAAKTRAQKRQKAREAMAGK